MKKLSGLLVLAFFALPTFAATESYKNVSVVDKNCSAKVTADPDTHTQACAIKCAASGFGIITADKKFIKFDATGNEKMKEELKASEKKDHLRVDVSGELEGDTLKVTSVKLL